MANDYFSLPDGLVDADAAAAQQYAATGGLEIVTSVDVPGSRGDALDLWIRTIWLQGAEPLVAGEGRAHVGAERLMTALGIQEKILSAGLPTNADDPQTVASLLYVVTNPGHVPVKEKLALVRFLRVDDATTRVVWTIKITPVDESAGDRLRRVVQGMLAKGTGMLTAAATGEDARL